MAEKDITEKILMSYADVFADCINTFVYDGSAYRGYKIYRAGRKTFGKGTKGGENYDV